MSYLEKVEIFFVEKRKKGLMISPKDWLVMEKWQEEGIPLATVLKGIENTFNNADSSAVGVKSKIHRLTYCEPEIRNLWQKSSTPSLKVEATSSLVDILDEIAVKISLAANRQEAGTEEAISDYAGEVVRMRDEVTETGMSAIVPEDIEVRLREGLVQLADRLQGLIDRDKVFHREVEAKLRDYRQTMEPETYLKTFLTILRDRILDSVGLSDITLYRL